ncbi:hypothetical protein [Olivibacter sitiensis]|uniref:hypothetical protein n=1 Tax=Olivibacter sitiensis TaxID=376470 RepID=UPI00040B84F8|nr:hypothetical protein [Olivibacter sitiensis]
MAPSKESIEQKLQRHISVIEADIAIKQEELEQAKTNLKNYLDNKEVIESILELHLAPSIDELPKKSKRKSKTS